MNEKMLKEILYRKEYYEDMLNEMDKKIHEMTDERTHIMTNEWKFTPLGKDVVGILQVGPHIHTNMKKHECEYSEMVCFDNEISKILLIKEKEI